MKFAPLDFSRIRTYALAERANKVALSDFAGVPAKGDSLAPSWKNCPASWPRTISGKSSPPWWPPRATSGPVILMMGAHPIKCGLNPVLVDAMKRGIISAVAFNGAGAIHDFETAYQGETSEDVQAGLDDGTFGMVDETSRP